MPELRGRFGSFPEAERYFRQKVNLPTRRWDDLWQGQHARAFVVAGATRDALLSDLRGAVDAAISKGETLADFRKRFDDIVKRNGWTGWTGEGTAAGRAWRTSVIYHTNLRVAYQAGRWETLKRFPYLMRRHHSIKNPRDQHKAWNGLIIRVDDPWLRTHYTPDGWGCRCDYVGVSEARLRAMGKSGPDQAPPPGPGDPPPEWAYHVGIANQGEQLASPALTKLANEKWTEMPARSHLEFGRPARVPVDATVAVPFDVGIRDPAQLRQAWAGLYGNARTLRDPSGADVLLTDQVVDHWLEDPKRLDGRERYLPLLQEVIERPFEIWANFARNEAGKIGVRRYYVKVVEADDGKAMTLVAEVLPGGVWGSFDFFRGARPQPRSRQGLLVWGRPTE